MPAYIEMPKLSDTMTEGVLVTWHKKVGDAIEIGDVVAEVETDKALMEMEAFEEGVLSEVYVAEGGKAQIGQKLALLLAPGEKPPGDGPPAAPAAAAVPTPASQGAAKSAPGTATSSPAPATPVAQSSASDGRVKASPLAKKIADSRGVNLTTVSGSGPGGRIVAKDVESAPAGRGAAIAAPVATGSDRRISLSGMRKAIADRLLASKTQIPHFYLNIEIDAGELMRLRSQINACAEPLGLPKLTVNDFVLKAAAVAAARVPKANASFAGDAIVEFASVHLAVAVAIDDGLVTPVIRDAQTRSLREISVEVKDLATRARSRKLKPEEYQGGTLTVSNLGSYGIESFSAIINPPQAIILAIGAIVKKPVVNSRDEIVVGQRMAIGLSADHRVVDGAIGAQYLAELRLLLENPAAMLV